MPAPSNSTRIQVKWLPECDRASFNGAIKSMQTTIPEHYNGFTTFTFLDTTSNYKPGPLIHENVSYAGQVMVVPTATDPFDRSNFKATLILRPLDTKGRSLTSTTVQDVRARVGCSKVMFGKVAAVYNEIDTVELSFAAISDTKVYATGHETYRWDAGKLTEYNPQRYKMPAGTSATDMTAKLNELLGAMEDTEVRQSAEHSTVTPVLPTYATSEPPKGMAFLLN